MTVFARLRVLLAVVSLAAGLFTASHAVAADTLALDGQLLARHPRPLPAAPAQSAATEPICDLFANGYDLVGAVPCASCFDGTNDVDETDIDCGGGWCKACSDGEQCSDDADCTSANCVSGVCAEPVCGNGAMEPGETCDDGNTSDETSCPYGQPSCMACNSTCTATLNLIGPFCGDGLQDGFDGEACDDGNTVTETSCAYGLPNCTQCNSTCSATLNLTGPFCGDGHADFDDGEVCDDGNNVTETSCSYGQPTCNTCDSTCTAVLDLTGPFCGDGVTDPENEICDDGNNVDETTCPDGQESCTTCNSTCSAVIQLP